MSGNEQWREFTTVTQRVIPISFCRDFNYRPVTIQLAGRITIESTHGAIDEQLLCGRQARHIFALLVVERDRPLHRDELAEALWPHGRPPTWGAALRGVISKVRAFLTIAGLSAPCAGFGTYQLQLPPDVVVDIESAGSAVDIAERCLRDDDPERAIAFAEDARVVATRPFLPGAKEQWVDGIREQLREVLLSALGVLTEGYAQRGRYRLAGLTAEQAIALEPFRERTHQLLMRVHTAAGNPAEALRVYERCRRILADELGVDPNAINLR